VPRGLLRRAGRLFILLPVEVGLGFSWGSLLSVLRLRHTPFSRSGKPLRVTDTGP